MRLSELSKMCKKQLELYGDKEIIIKCSDCGNTVSITNIEVVIVDVAIYFEISTGKDTYFS